MLIFVRDRNIKYIYPMSFKHVIAMQQIILIMKQYKRLSKLQTFLCNEIILNIK